MWRACWQGSIVVLAVWTICRLLPSMPARFQCWLWRLAILKFMVVLLCPSLLNLPLLPAPPVAIPIPAEVGLQIGHGHASWPRKYQPAQWITLSSVDRPLPSKAIELPSFGTILCFAWIIGVGWCLVRLLAAWYEAIRLRRQSHIIACTSVDRTTGDAGKLFGLRTLPRLVEVEGGGSPMLIGIFRPAIVIPAETLGRLSISEQTMVLGHELALKQANAEGVRGDFFAAEPGDTASGRGYGAPAKGFGLCRVSSRDSVALSAVGGEKRTGASGLRLQGDALNNAAAGRS